MFRLPGVQFMKSWRRAKKRGNSCNVGKTMPETIPNHHFYWWYKAFPNWWFMTFYDIVLTTSQNDCINMLLIWSCFWSNMTLRFASAVRVFENPFSEFPFSPCNDINECNSLTRVDGLFLLWRSSMSVAVPRGWHIWSLIEDLQCKSGQFRVWTKGASRA